MGTQKTSIFSWIDVWVHTQGWHTEINAEVLFDQDVDLQTTIPDQYESLHVFVVSGSCNDSGLMIIYFKSNCQK